MFKRFQEVLHKLHGEAILTPDREIPGVLRSLMDKHRWQRIAVYNLDEPKMLAVLNTLGDSGKKEVVVLPGQKPANFDNAALRDQLAETEVAISPVDYLVAQTGTAVFINNRHPSSLLTLLPPAVILIASLEHMVKDLWGLYERIEKDIPGEEPAVSFFTGPSRTADIEKTLVLGVHGPHQLFIFVTYQEDQG